MILGDYAWFLANQDRYAEAGPLLEQAIAIQRLVHGDMHLCVACSLQRVCALRLWQGDHVAAEPVCRESLSINERLEPEPRPFTNLDRENLALALIPLGKAPEAARLAQDTLAHYHTRYGERHVRTAVVKRILGSAVSHAGDPVAGEAFLRQSVDTFHNLPGCDKWARAAAESDLADCLILQGRFDEAEPLLVEAQEVLQDTRGISFAETQKALRRLIVVYDESGKHDEAQHYREVVQNASLAQPVQAVTAIR
jgi:tetratricopeptide (TPR) repeat protein